MKTPVEISQISGSTPLANNQTINRRYAISSIVDMVVQNITELPSSVGAFTTIDDVRKLGEANSTHEKLVGLRTLQETESSVLESLTRAHIAQVKGKWAFPYLHLLTLIAQSQPKFIRSPLDVILCWIRIPLVLLNTLFSFIEALLKVIACGLTDSFLWNCNNLTSNQTHFCYKLFIAFPLFFVTGLTYSVGQLIYFVANNLSYLRYTIDAVINLPISVLAFIFCCGDKSASFFRCLGTLIKNLLLLAPTAAIPLIIMFVPAVNAAVLPFLTATLAMVVAQPLVISAALVYSLVGIAASSVVVSIVFQSISGGIRLFWDTIESFCLRCCCGNPANKEGYAPLAATPGNSSQYDAQINNTVASAATDGVEMQATHTTPVKREPTSILSKFLSPPSSRTSSKPGVIPTLTPPPSSPVQQ